MTEAIVESEKGKIRVNAHVSNAAICIPINNTLIILAPLTSNGAFLVNMAIDSAINNDMKFIETKSGK